MTLRNCIVSGQKEGLITDEQAAEATDIYNQLELEYQGKMSPEAAAAAAGKDTFDQLKANVAHRRRVTLMQAGRWKALQRDLVGYRSAGGKERPGAALTGLVERDHQSGRYYSDLYYRQDAVRLAALSQMDAILGRFRRGMVGQTRNKAELPTLVKEIFGEDTGNVAAREMAQAWWAVEDYLRQTFNAAGGRIPKRADWGLPQTHDNNAVRRAGREQWLADLEGQLHPDMASQQTGQTFTPDGLKLALNDVYESIAFEGLTGQIAPTVKQGKALHNRHLDHRFLKFKDADAWLKYQMKYGEPDPFHAMISYVDSMARDIAHLEILGPNPAAMVEALKRSGRQHALKLREAGDKGALNQFDTDIKEFESLYNFWQHPNEIGNERWAAIGAGARDLMGSAMLGSAVISAISDLNTQRITTAMIGMPQTKMLSRIFSGLMTLNQTDRGMMAARLGVAADTWSRTAYSQMRLFGESTGPNITARIADTTHKLSGLNRWTHANRQATGIELLGYLADVSGQKFDDLSDVTQRAFQRYNISAEEWEVIRKTKLHDESGAKFLRPLDVEMREGLEGGLGRGLARKLMEMVAREIDMGTPSASLRSRALWRADTKAGSLVGELGRSAGMFKSFPVTVVGNNLGRYLLDPTIGGKWSRAGTAMSFVIGATFMGAIAYQAKTMLRGRDPQPMDEQRFWMAALLQGGGMGIFGDFLFSDVARHGKGFGTTISGPGAGLIDDLLNLTVGNVGQITSGTDTSFGNESMKFIERYTPGSSIWYLRAAYERTIMDQIRKAVDPKAEQRFYRKMKSHEKYYGAKHWWEPGEVLPSRAPDFTSAMGR